MEFTSFRANATAEPPHRTASLSGSARSSRSCIPTLFTWVYFVYAADFPTGLQQAIYSDRQRTSIRLSDRVGVGRAPRAAHSAPAERAGMLLGAAFSIVVVGASWLRLQLLPARHDHLCRCGTDDSRATRSDRHRHAVEVRPAGRVLLAVPFAVGGVLWRWFAFGQLRRLCGCGRRSSSRRLAFMGHHVVVLGKFFQGQLWVGLLLSSAVTVGGVFWAWLYDRTGSLLGPWMSHLMIDAGIFWVGYELIGDSLSAGIWLVGRLARPTSRAGDSKCDKLDTISSVPQSHWPQHVVLAFRPLTQDVPNSCESLRRLLNSPQLAFPRPHDAATLIGSSSSPAKGISGYR